MIRRIICWLESIQRFIRWIGDLFAWTMPLLMIAIVTLVILESRVFKIGSIKLQELQWHLYAMAVMIGLSYALISDSHIRVDAIQHRFSKHTKATIDIFGIVLLLFPFLIFLFWHSLPYVGRSFAVQERSNSPSGLPWRWLINSFIPLGCCLLFLAGLSHVMRCIAVFGKK